MKWCSALPAALVGIARSLRGALPLNKDDSIEVRRLVDGEYLVDLLK